MGEEGQLNCLASIAREEATERLYRWCNYITIHDLTIYDDMCFIVHDVADHDILVWICYIHYTYTYIYIYFLRYGMFIWNLICETKNVWSFLSKGLPIVAPRFLISLFYIFWYQLQELEVEEKKLKDCTIFSPPPCADGDFGTHYTTGYRTIFCPPFTTGRPCEEGWLAGLHSSVWRMLMRIYGRSKRPWRTRWQLDFYNACNFTYRTFYFCFRFVLLLVLVLVLILPPVLLLLLVEEEEGSDEYCVVGINIIASGIL